MDLRNRGIGRVRLGREWLDSVMYCLYTIIPLEMSYDFRFLSYLSMF